MSDCECHIVPCSVCLVHLCPKITFRNLQNKPTKLKNPVFFKNKMQEEKKREKSEEGKRVPTGKETQVRGIMNGEINTQRSICNGNFSKQDRQRHVIKQRKRGVEKFGGKVNGNLGMWPFPHVDPDISQSRYLCSHLPWE